MIYLLNSLVIPIDPKISVIWVRMKRATVEEVRNLLATNNWESAVGHEGTASLLSKILGVEVPMRRVSIYAKPGDLLIHFALRMRLPEGRVLSEEELRQLDFEFIVSEVYGDVPPQRG
jgi:hypothetical protein